MGLGSTAKKIQIVSERAEQVYKQIQELQQRIIHLEQEVDDTHEAVTKMDHRTEENRALLLAIAEEQGVDADQVVAEAAIDDADDLAAGRAEGGQAAQGTPRQEPREGSQSR